MELCLIAVGDPGRLDLAAEPDVCRRGNAVSRDDRENPDCWLAHNNLGAILQSQGRLDEALAHCRKALQLEPDEAGVYINVGSILADQGHLNEAIASYQKALKLKPNEVRAYNGLGLALAGGGRLDEALVHYRKALEINPWYVSALINAGNALATRGQLDEALAYYRKVLAIAPGQVEVHNNIGLTLANSGRCDEALTHYQQVLEVRPDDAPAHNNLGNALVALGRFDEAATQYRLAPQVRPQLGPGPQQPRRRLIAPRPMRRGPGPLPSGGESPTWQPGFSEESGLAARLARRLRYAMATRPSRWPSEPTGSRQAGPDVLDALAAAYAEAGWFPEALATARKALRLAKQHDERALADALQARIALYEAGRPYHETPMSSPEHGPPTK